MKVAKDRVMVFSFLWGAAFYFLAWLSSRFYWFSFGLLPLAVYEFKRTEGKKNTKPLSFLVSLTLVLQFLHTAKIYPFPWEVTPLLRFLPVEIPAGVDPFLFLSVLVLVIFSLMLVKYTWGSVTKFLAISLLAGSLIQAYIFWPEIQQMLTTPEGQKLLEGQKERIRNNLYYRLRRELLY